MSIPGPLDQILVLDFSRVLAGPFCTMTLADMGAKVIKVESPSGDDARNMGPFRNGESLYFASINRGKKSIIIDLKQNSGREVAADLCKKADVIVENYRPGTMRKFGLDYKTLRDTNPGLIYLSLSGFGHSGPYSDRGAYDVIIQAMSGLMGITGQEDGLPTRVGASIGDMIPALYGVSSVLAALFQRSKSGEGAWIDLAMLDSVFALSENALARYQVSSTDPVPLGNRHPSITPFGSFNTANGQIIIACGNDVLWTRLCQTIDQPQLAKDSRFLTNASRTTNVLELIDLLENSLSAQTAEYWLEKLLEAGIPSAMVSRMSDLLVDTHLKQRNMLLDVKQPDGSIFTAPGSPLKGDGISAHPGKSSPALGSDTISVLETILHMQPTDIETLLQEKSILSPQTKSSK